MKNWRRFDVEISTLPAGEECNIEVRIQWSVNSDDEKTTTYCPLAQPDARFMVPHKSIPNPRPMVLIIGITVTLPACEKMAGTPWLIIFLKQCYFEKLPLGKLKLLWLWPAFNWRYTDYKTGSDMTVGLRLVMLPCWNSTWVPGWWIRTDFVIVRLSSSLIQLSSITPLPLQEKIMSVTKKRWLLPNSEPSVTWPYHTSYR